MKLNFQILFMRGLGYRSVFKVVGNALWRFVRLEKQANQPKIFFFFMYGGHDDCYLVCFLILKTSQY